MPELKPLKELKIHALTVMIHYPVRGNFASDCQKLIDSVCQALNPKLRKAGLEGVVDSEVDSDGDIIFKYDTSTFDFRLESRPNLSAAQFRQLNDHDLALTVLESFVPTIPKALEIDSVDKFSVNFSNVFHLASRDKPNYDIFRDRMLPQMQQKLSPLMKEDVEIGRVDFKIGWKYDQHFHCYYSLECPGNEDNTTVWTTLHLQTRGDIEAKTELLDVRKCYQIYTGPYSDHLHALLSGIAIDYSKRQLERDS